MTDILCTRCKVSVPQEALHVKDRCSDAECPLRVRRRRVEGCKACDAGGFGPYHDASANCESGKHPHCSCDTCF